MSAAEILFDVFAAIAIAAAIGTVTRRNPVVAALLLVVTFFAVAVAYVLLDATFLASIQILVYAGAMMVLFVFVVMVLDVDPAGAIRHRTPPGVGRFLFPVMVLAASGFTTWILLGTLARQYVSPGADVAEGFGSAQAVGRELFRAWLFPFEAVSFLLLAAVIGAVVVARTKAERQTDASDVDPRARARAEAGPVPAAILTRRAHKGDI